MSEDKMILSLVITRDDYNELAIYTTHPTVEDATSKCQEFMNSKSDSEAIRFESMVLEATVLKKIEKQEKEDG